MKAWPKGRLEVEESYFLIVATANTQEVGGVFQERLARNHPPEATGGFLKVLLWPLESLSQH